MIYDNCPQNQIEAWADQLNRCYDGSRMVVPKPVDVYDIVDMIGAHIALEYLSPDRTYLGATLFRPGNLWVWPGNPYGKDMMPEKKRFYGDTIIVDRDLSKRKSKQDEYTENFTVMHECYHFQRHRKFFGDSRHMSESMSDYSKHATKHMNEAVTSIKKDAPRIIVSNPKMYSQFILYDYWKSLSRATSGGVKYGKLIRSGNWEFVFSKSREQDSYPVVKHAQFLGLKQGGLA